MNQGPKRKTLVLTVTHDCNLACSYCYEHQKTEKVMSPDVAKRSIIETFENSDGYDEINIDFMGGEPFLNFPLIKEISEWIWSRDWEKSYIISASTNGTKIHGRIKKWLAVNKERFTVCLSCDGTRDMHNQNRSYSFDLIDFSFYLACWPDQSLKLTVSPATLPSLSEGIVFLTELGFLVTANLAYGVSWENESYLDIFSQELAKLIEYYREHPDAPVCSLLSHNITILAFDFNNNFPTAYCGTGKGLTAVDVDGEVYPCHTFTPLALGANAKKMGTLDFDSEKLIDPACRECSIFMACPTCYGINFSSTGDPARRPKDLCRLHKIQILSNLKFNALQLIDRKHEIGSVSDGESYLDEYLSIKAILRTYETILETVGKEETLAAQHF